ncbi:NAD-dependent epimerase/dehydratase family protein [Candidatus Micrarchaeota archaeon]|nr:NAD-dependent epimerase/dehydratase family protein [Candidatus Micrarchaeota archaeon]
MKALVTGGAGFIGSHVVGLLLENGFETAVVDNLSTGKKGNVNPVASLQAVDITNEGALEQVFVKEKPEIVFHLAAQANARVSAENPLFDAKTNLLGSINVLECCRKHGVKKIVYSSSCAVYGKPQAVPVNEAHEIAPVLPYGASKHAVEHYLEIYRGLYGIDFVALRYANVYGPRQDGKGEGGVIAVFTEKLLSGAALTVNGDGEQMREFVFVKDVAKANLAAATRSASKRFLNIGSGNETSVNQLVSLLQQATKLKPKVVHAAPVAGEVRRMLLDSSLAAAELGWKPTVSISEGLRETIDWAKGR